MVTAVEMTEKAQLRKEWRWRFCPLTFREICPGRINNSRIQWLWLCLMTLHRKKNHKKNELSGAEILRKLLRSICSCPIALSLSFFSEGKQIDVLHLVRGPSGCITRPWQEAPKPGFFAKISGCQTNTSAASHFITWPPELWNLNTYILTWNNIGSRADLSDIPLILRNLLCCQIWAWPFITARVETVMEDAEGQNCIS